MHPADDELPPCVGAKYGHTIYDIHRAAYDTSDEETEETTDE